MAVRKIKTISPMSSIKPGELEFEITTLDGKKHSFKADGTSLSEFFLQVGAIVAPKKADSGELTDYSVMFNEITGKVALSIRGTGPGLDMILEPPTAETLGQQLIEAAASCRSRTSRPQ